MAHAQLHKGPTHDAEVELFERQRIRKLEIAIAILATLIVGALIAAHVIGSGMPGPVVY
jgi:hypothetical protein